MQQIENKWKGSLVVVSKPLFLSSELLTHPMAMVMTSFSVGFQETRNNLLGA